MTALTGLTGGILARLRERLAARPDTEHEQALVRLLLGALILGYLLIVGSGQQLEPTVVVMAGYLVWAALFYAMLGTVLTHLIGVSSPPSSTSAH